MQSYMALQSCNDIWTLFECFLKRNKQASHLNVCLLLLGVLACAWRRLIYAVSLALLRIMSDTVYVPPLVLACQFQSIRWRPASKVSTLDHDTLQLVAQQQWWHIHYSMDPDFQHRSSPLCHIQQDDL